MRPAPAQWLILLALTAMPALSGCGPSRGQVLFYEIELAITSFGVLCLLMWLGRVLFDSRVWFVCSYCLEPDARHDVRDGTMTTCAHCGETTSVNELPADQVRRVSRERGPRRVRLVVRTRAGRLLVTLLLAVTFQIVLVGAGVLLVYLLRPASWPGFDKYRAWHEVAFPLVFALSWGGEYSSPWWLCNWILVLSYHFGLGISEFVGAVPGVPAFLSLSPGCFIAVTLAQLALWWVCILLGYRLRVRWWLVPSVVAGLNVLVAVTAYIAEWNL